MKKNTLKKIQQLFTPLGLHKTPLPSIQCVHFSSDGETQMVHATDAETELVLRFPNPNPTTGLVEWETIKKESKNPEDEIQLGESDIPLTEFPPPLVKRSGLTTENIKAEELLLALGSLTPYMSDNVSRPVLCGIHFRLTEDGFRLEASDGHQLRAAAIDIGAFRENLNGSFIMDRKAVRLLVVNLKKARGWVSVTYDPNEVWGYYMFRFDNPEGWDVTLSGRKMPGKYPFIDAVIRPLKVSENQSSHVVSHVKESLVDHLKYIRPKKSDVHQCCTFHIEKGVVRITPPDGEPNTEGGELVGCFWPQYLENFFNLALGEAMEIHYKYEYPLWSEFEKQGVELITVVMPYRKN